MAAELARRGRWRQTYTARKFWPLDPRAEDVCGRDIAHHLAMICRYGGSSLYHYSVAQHSVMVMDHCPPELQLAGLLHDSAEAYLGDVIRPIKYDPAFAEVRALEEKVLRVIFEAFGLDHLPFPEVVKTGPVKEADERVGATEKRDVMAPGLNWGESADYPLQPYDDRILQWTPSLAEARFRLELERLTVAAGDGRRIAR